MSDQDLMNQIVKDLQEINEVQRLLDSLVLESGPKLDQVEGSTCLADAEAGEATTAGEKVYQTWWKCTIL